MDTNDNSSVVMQDNLVLRHVATSVKVKNTENQYTIDALGRSLG